MTSRTESDPRPVSGGLKALAQDVGNQRKRTLSLHTLHDFIGMEKHENFSYEVLFGDKNAISQMLGEPQRV